MSPPQIVVIPIDNSDDPDVDRFKKMMEEFEYFATKSAEPFAPCGFLHQMLNKVLDRIYAAAYNEIGRAQDPRPFICAATHIKRCKELSSEMTEQIAAAMRDMHCGDPPDTDMMRALNQLVKILHSD